METLALLLDASEVTTVFSVLSSIPLIATAVFVVLQLRHMGRQNKSNISISFLQKLTDESFPRRRKMMYDIVKKYSQNNWDGFDDSFDAFEARIFAWQYSIHGVCFLERNTLTLQRYK